jgi:hypothetical protein
MRIFIPMAKQFYKGKFRPTNISKYVGDSNDIIFRSSWELRFMKWCDSNPSIIEWGSEIAVIPYVSPVDKRIHRYFVDFYIKVKNTAGQVQKYLIEIKPESQTKPPPIPQKKTKRFIDEVFTYGVNSAKWKSANEFCEDRGWKFLVLTEKELGIK